MLKNAQSILNSMPFLAWLKDKQGKYVLVNSAFEDFYRIKNTEIVGKTDFDFFPHYVALEHKRSEEELIKSKNWQPLLPLHHEVGGQWLETFVAPFFEEARGEVIGTIGIARNITERKQLEIDLANQKRFLKTIIDTIPDFIFYKNTKSVLLGCNKAYAEKVLGVSEDEAIGKIDLEGMEDIESVQFYQQNDQEELLTLKYEGKFALTGGNVISTETVKTTFLNEQGNVAGLIGIARDITERKQLESQLRESKERYSAIVNNAPQIVVIFKQGIIEFVNNAGIEVLGYNEECVRHHMKGFKTETLFGSVNSALLDSIRGEHCVSYEIELIKKSGEIINVLLKGTEIPYEREKATLAVMMDITESKQLNLKLRASEEKFRQLAETINEVFLITDGERIVYVSPAYERISGMSCQSLLDNQSSLLELIHPADRERMQASFYHGSRTKNEDLSEEFRITRPDGETRWLWMQSYPIRDEANPSSRRAMTIVDITDRKKAEDKLREREHQTQIEVMLAARVQRDSLPRPLVNNKVRVRTIFEPRSTISGDFLNYKWFGEQEKLCGYIIDVSGHGVATALQTATFKMLLDNVLLTGERIEEEVLQTINQKIMQYLYEDSFVALLYFEFDFRAGVLKLICAGITLFLAANPQGCSLVPIYGCYLGIIDHPEIETKIISLNPGDIYCLMSDGASDLLELHGLRKQGSFAEYKNWLEEMAKCPERNDDFSVICVEILHESKGTSLLKIKSDADLERAQVTISEFLERNAPGQAPMMEVAVNEAINNGFLACGQVFVKARRIGGRLIIRVKDDCQGFDTKDVNVRRKTERYEEEFEEMLDAEGGRGILLMKMVCDKVIYNAKGNEVLLMKVI
ncbi:SpoIIE family protein phosphatase [Desulfosporosinus youngiae]|uniref:PAS domain S-box n=1 Tax=Desulfosporosinus youngiae DSM 17734 TaxID=768710 RepID=H5XX00_9FIRM|nr:PAS domain S-box protein [Desulfosporosinus youngiae]EHQ90868.1 PAS domain S-box [Desulfosporosinus youngiae DSM 17734]